MGALSRKKITVKGRHGTYQRSVMVRSEKAPPHQGRIAPLTPTQMLKRHGVAIAWRGAVEGASGHVGGQVGAHAFSRIHDSKATRLFGGLAGSHLAGKHTARTLYENTDRGQHVMEDFYRGSTKTKLAFHGIRLASVIGGHMAARAAQRRVGR